MELALQLLNEDFDRLSRAISQGDETGIYKSKLEKVRKAIFELKHIQAITK